MGAKLTKARRNALLGRARAKFIANCWADKIWKTLAALPAISDRDAALARLRTHAGSNPDLAAVVSAIAKALKRG